MRTPPPIPNAAIAMAVRMAHGLNVSNISFVGGGEVAWGYRLDTDKGPRWLKLYPPNIIPAACLAATHWLHRRLGIRSIVSPHAVSNGQFAFDIAGYQAVMFPYIEGATWEQQSLSEAQEHELGALLATLHGAQTRKITLPVETFSTDAADNAERVLRALPDAYYSSQIYRHMLADLLLPVQEVFHEQIIRQRETAVHARAKDVPFAICHGDPTDDNIMVDDRHLYLLDWDNMRLAPKEFDLMHFPPDSPVLAAYGADCDETLLDFYHATWNNEELVTYAGRVLFHDMGDEQHQHDIETMRAILRELGADSSSS